MYTYTWVYVYTYIYIYIVGPSNCMATRIDACRFACTAEANVVRYLCFCAMFLSPLKRGLRGSFAEAFIVRLVYSKTHAF